MPRVARFSIAPVKGLAMLHPDEILLTRDGVAEDRRFFLVDDDGRLVDRLRVGWLVQAAAWTDAAGARLRVTLPDGSEVEADVREADPIVVTMYGRTVVGHVVDGPWADALAPLAGMPVRLVRTDRPGGTRTHHQSTLVSDGSLEALAAQVGAGGIDARRFRMLIELEGAAAHEEDAWVGERIGLGETVLRVSKGVARCAITTQDPDTGVRDLDTLRLIREYRGMSAEATIDFGVYGEVEVPGRIRLGDAVRRLGDAAESAESAESPEVAAEAAS